MIPIVLDQNQNHIVGTLNPDGYVRFKNDIEVTADMLPMGLSYTVLQKENKDGRELIRSMRILHLAVGPMTGRRKGRK